MDIAQVRKAIKETPKGSNIILEWTRPCKVRKGVVAVIAKAVRMVGRMGIEYDNQNEVQEKREGGDLPAVNAGLPWGKWLEYPWLIEHNGKLYLRLYNGTSTTTTPRVAFFIDGIPTTKEAVAHYLLASELAEKSGDCFTCGIENLTHVHHEQVAVEEPALA